MEKISYIIFISNNNNNKYYKYSIYSNVEFSIFTLVFVFLILTVTVQGFLYVTEIGHILYIKFVKF